MRTARVFRPLSVFIVLSAPLGAVHGQTVHVPSRRPMAANVIVPQCRHFGGITSPGLFVESVTANIDIVEQVATTTLDIVLRNNGSVQTEGELLFPVPDGAVVREFNYDGVSAASRVEILAADEARRIYNEIVAKMRDPALLEFAALNVIRTSVFPIPPGGSQKVRVGYESILPRDKDRVDYVLPRSESLDYRVPWQVTVRISAKRPIMTVYSPSHEIATQRQAENIVKVNLTRTGVTEPGAFRVSYLLGGENVNATLLAYPDSEIGGGYFLLLGGLPAGNDENSIKRELTLVLDRSGSMAGDKINQVREAAKQVIAGLGQGEAFNIITYSDTITSFAGQPVIKNGDTERDARKFLDDVRAEGGTNIHAALTEALRQKPTSEMLPIVLFLTDGLPTVGDTSEIAIRDLATKSNPFERRIFTFGVGADVNAALLDKVATASRAMATYVLPGEDVEVKVAQVYRGLKGPILTNPKLAAVADGSPRVEDMLPAELPDQFEGGQIVILGKYRGDAPLNFRLTGNYRGQNRVFEFAFPLDGATVSNAFVPRLWASRKIGVLVDAITQMGGSGKPVETVTDPRLRELVDEVVRLGTKFGILTEYTAFLAREDVDLDNHEDVMAAADENFKKRALASREGLAGINQAINRGSMRDQSCANYDNGFWDANMNRVSIANVQQVCDLAFYRRGGRWIDSRVVHKAKDLKPTRTIAFGSAEFRQLAERLAAHGRAGAISLDGDVVIEVDNETILIETNKPKADVSPSGPEALKEEGC